MTTVIAGGSLRVASEALPTIGDLLDRQLDVPPDRRPFVADVLKSLGYSVDEEAGAALGALTEAQRRSVRVSGAGLTVRDTNAVLAMCKTQGIPL